jgi:hypothetical protein
MNKIMNWSRKIVFGYITILSLYNLSLCWFTENGGYVDVWFVASILCVFNLVDEIEGKA